MRAHWWGLYVVAAAAGMLVGCANTVRTGDPFEEMAAATVEMVSSLRFQPDTVTIAAGQTVRWKNVSDFVHTVTCQPSLAGNAKDCSLPAGAKPFNSGNVEPGETFSHKFTVPGDYRYFCIPHEMMGMVGQVVVKPAGRR